MSAKRSFEPRQILCPIDFSGLSDLALKYAAAGAREYKATLIILHAQAFDLPRYFKRDLVDSLIEELDAAKQHLRDHLAQHVEKLLHSKVLNPKARPIPKAGCMIGLTPRSTRNSRCRRWSVMVTHQSKSLRMPGKSGRTLSSSVRCISRFWRAASMAGRPNWFFGMHRCRCL